MAGLGGPPLGPPLDAPGRPRAEAWGLVSGPSHTPPLGWDRLGGSQNTIARPMGPRTEPASQPFLPCQVWGGTGGVGGVGVQRGWQITQAKKPTGNPGEMMFYSPFFEIHRLVPLQEA